MLDHVRDAISNAKFFYDPWPHLCVPNIFPKDTYETILANLPSTDDEAELIANGNRQLFWIIKYGEPVQSVSDFWKEFRKMLPYWQLELEIKFSVKGKNIGCEILHDFTTYYIGPHTDTPNKLITGLIYLPRTEADAKCGTELYYCADPDPGGKGHRFSNHFATVKTIPYLPNTALFFKRTDMSYHGVRPSLAERWVLAFDIFK